MRSIVSRHRVLITTAAAIALACSLSSTARAQMNFAQTGRPSEPGLELLQDEPYDLVVFKEEAGGGWVKAHRIDFPDRQLPRNPDGILQFQILGIEDKTFSVAWKDIAGVDLWEVRLEREAHKRIQQRDFVGAYPFLSVLLRDYPERDELKQLRSDFLWLDAITRAGRGEISATLAVLEELRRYAPAFKEARVLQAIDGAADRLIQGFFDEGELDLAQQMLARLTQDYEETPLDSVVKWNGEFLRMAEDKQREAIAARDAGDFRAAREFALASVHLKPSIAGGRQLVQELNTLYPLVNVGVLQTATTLEPTRIENWAARRAGRLVYRSLFEIKGAGPEGGEYEFIFGDVESSPDRMHFDLLLKTGRLPSPLNRIQGVYVADAIAARAQPGSDSYFAPWAAAVESISMDGPKQVSFHLRRPNVMPIGLLQIPVDGSWFGGEPNSPTGDYRLSEASDGVTRFVLSGEPRTPMQPREFVEKHCESAMEGVNWLLQGEIDVLDQLFPADAVRLRRNRSVRVANYPLPTVHMLVPCSDHPYLAKRTFRRALVYGTNRQDILHGELLEGLEAGGCRVLSGPFPAGLETNDPLGYAYDQSIMPRPYEPPLARLLLAMTTNQMRAEKRDGQAIEGPTPIRLAHPPDNLSRVACDAIRSQWLLLGLEVELVELPVGRTFPVAEEDIADLVYVSAAVWEPVIDARRILGPEGLAGSADQLIGLGLRRLEEARNWRDVRNRLLDLHAITHHELPVLPLWQMVDSYAYRRELTGVGTDIVSLYQNADKWRLSQ